MASVIPLLMCKSLQTTLEFYELLGFAVTYRQDDPYPYASIQYDGVELHITRRTDRASCLVFVESVAPLHQAYANALRTAYGKVPTAELPRLTRLHKGQTRFHVFDPAGNRLVYIQTNEDEATYNQYQPDQTSIEAALENATFLCDTYTDDKAAARVLDLALARHPMASPIERARLLACRAEIAIAMGHEEESRQFRQQLAQLVLSEEERQSFEDELNAPDVLEQWITTPPVLVV